MPKRVIIGVVKSAKMAKTRVVEVARGWQEPINLGLNVNTPADEFSPAFSPDGSLLYFASNRAQPAENASSSRDATSVAKTARPVPVSSDSNAARLALDGVVRNVRIAAGKSANAAVPEPV